MNSSGAFHALADFIPFGLSVEDAISFLAAGAIFLTVLAICHGLRIGDPLEKRLRGIQQRRSELRAQWAEPRRRNDRLRPMTRTAMHALVRRFNLLQSQQASEAQILLARAGIRAEGAMVRYLFARLVMPMVFGFTVAIDAYWIPVIVIGDGYKALAVLFGILLGSRAPQLYLKNLADKRYAQISRALPDGLDLMVICAGAGLSLDGSLQRVARELGKSWPALAEEFTLTAVEMTFLPERRQALENLIQRVDLPSIRGVVNTLQQTEKFGTPLVQSLRVLAAEFRDQRMLKAEEKAARLSVLLTLPLILFIMPALFVVLLGPAALDVLDMMNK